MKLIKHCQISLCIAIGLFIYTTPSFARDDNQVVTSNLLFTYSYAEYKYFALAHGWHENDAVDAIQYSKNIIQAYARQLVTEQYVQETLNAFGKVGYEQQKGKIEDLKSRARFV